MNFLFPETLAASDAVKLGGKGAALARLSARGFEVPPWFAVPPDNAVDGGSLVLALRMLGEGAFAVRSSAALEDGAGHSFAGQYETFLHVAAVDVAARIEDVRASARRDAVVTYCRERGLPMPATPTVLVQRMIAPRCAGVAFSADPVSGQRGVAVVSAVAGTGEKLVSGEVDGETWRIGRAGQRIGDVPGDLLTETEAAAVAELARRCADTGGRPQDIEWAIDGAGKLWLLQSRPITTLNDMPDPDDVLRVWDNSNIAESYGGVTTPLTFSFARRIYEAVYREFCALMSVPASRITKADDVFPQMLGMIRGRVYYNLASWYRVLALLPGFQLNRGFMEQMMGVREPLPDELVEKIIAESRTSRMRDALSLIRTCGGLLSQWWGLPRQFRRFENRLNEALAATVVPLERMSGDELVEHYRALERQLLKRWDAPLVNDFFAMIAYGMLRSLSAKWLNDTTGSLQNELLVDCGEIISAEPPRRIARMAELVARNPKLAACLLDPEIPVERKLKRIQVLPDLKHEFDRYLTDFGDRCLEELKLESPTVRDDASSLLSAIGGMAMRDVSSVPVPPVTDLPKIENVVKRWCFARVLQQARTRVRCRENLRFERTRVFGRVRCIVRELGKRLHADGQLDAPEDVFYLELDELFAAWEGTGTSARLAGLAAQRRTEFEVHEASDAPPDRFQTRGPICRYAKFESAATPEVPMDGVLKGNGACPGVVTGRVRVVIDPRQARLEPGEILVARQTDPGWVVLFPAASGLLVERGSLLSHSAIVSRELRLPCIVSLPGITQSLKTGDLVRMDGARGTVEVLES